jgi:hypothetical protein
MKKQYSLILIYILAILANCVTTSDGMVKDYNIIDIFYEEHEKETDYRRKFEVAFWNDHFDRTPQANICIQMFMGEKYEKTVYIKDAYITYNGKKIVLVKRFKHTIEYEYISDLLEKKHILN